MHADICKFNMKIILKNQDYLCDTVSDSEYGVFSIHILSYFGQKWYILIWFYKDFMPHYFSTIAPTHAKFVALGSALCIALQSSETWNK